MSTDRNRRSDALQVFQAALAAADSRAAVRRSLQLTDWLLIVDSTHIQLDNTSRMVTVGAGKASAQMAQVVEEILGERISAGLVSVKEGHGAATRMIEVREASHPLPDSRSLANGQAIIARVRGLSSQDVVLCLISGGGSALMEALGEGLSLEHLRTITGTLMHAGANIVELNCVRKHLSLIKGGQLARWAQPATVCSLILSDVVGDDLSSIASGPTCADPTTFADAIEVMRRFEVDRLSEAHDVNVYLERGVRGEVPDTPKPDDPLFGKVHNVIIGSNRLALEAAAQHARSLGYATELITAFLQGEAREVGKVLAAMAREKIVQGAQRLCLLAGGETTVTVRGNGQGGRNQELVLSAALALDGIDGVTVLSAATDGGDGSSDAAGAMADGRTLRRARAAGLNAQHMLDQNDSHHFFQALNDQVVSGPTGTNVNDVVIMIIDST